MGQLINGQWRAAAMGVLEKGEFKRAEAHFRNWITADGSPGATGHGGYEAQSARYHLYVSYACPWAHRTLIFRALKGLKDHISVSVVSPDMLTEGWTFETDFDGTTGDTLFGHEYLHQIYTRAAADVSTRVSVPVLWDKQTNTIVSNESSEIIRMFNSAFDGIIEPSQDFWPADQQDAIEEVNKRIYGTLNNGVYRCGFAQTQAAYEAAVTQLFDTMDWLENRLADQRYLMGDDLTEADFRLLPTLLRFDQVYHYHFKCNIRRVQDYPALWGYTRELFQMPGVKETTKFDHIKQHYFFSHESINPHRIVPMGPDIDFNTALGRG